MIKGDQGYDTMELEEVVGKLRFHELNMRKKETCFNLVQDPGMYYGVPSTSFINASSDNADGEVCFVAASGRSTWGKRQQASNHSSSTRSMPLSVKAAEEHLALIASFVASYEN
ncbi:hypothetical protein Hanom_Chr01g00048551 [Helianthus anomalus]